MTTDPEAPERPSDAAPERRVEAAIAGIYERGAAVRRREADQALRRLEDAGTVTDDRRAAVETLAARLTVRLLAAPTEHLRSTADDPETVEAALALFDADQGSIPRQRASVVPVGQPATDGGRDRPADEPASSREVSDDGN